MGQSPAPRQARTATPGPGPGKGGRRAGFGSAAPTQENKDVKVARLPPNAKVPGKRSTPNPGPAITYQAGPDGAQRSTVPYYRAYAQARRTAESAVERENIPAEYRRQVKEYFESIKP